MLNVDIPTIERFFGTIDGIESIISPMKHCRIYLKKGGKKNDIIFVLTKFFNNNATQMVSNLHKYGAKKYKIKNRYVYSLIK